MSIFCLPGISDSGYFSCQPADEVDTLVHSGKPRYWNGSRLVDTFPALIKVNIMCLYCAYLGSVILVTSLANLPMKLTLSSTLANLGIGMAVD